jgi:hypothetical protein
VGNNPVLTSIVAGLGDTGHGGFYCLAARQFRTSTNWTPKSHLHHVVFEDVIADLKIAEPM